MLGNCRCFRSTYLRPILNLHTDPAADQNGEEVDYQASDSPHAIPQRREIDYRPISDWPSRKKWTTCLKHSLGPARQASS